MQRSGPRKDLKSLKLYLDSNVWPSKDNITVPGDLLALLVGHKRHLKMSALTLRYYNGHYHHFLTLYSQND